MDLNMKILVVDDFATMRRIIKNVLKQIGFTNVSEADDGTTGLDMMKKEEFDLILCDWNMPQMTGLELLKIVKADDKLKGIPFVMVTAEAQKENILDAVKSGVNNYIVKPFTAETVKEKLKIIFGS